MNPVHDASQYVRVACPICKAVLHPRVEKAGRHVRCPDCHSAVLVPQPPKPEPPKPSRKPGEYAVTGTGGKDAGSNRNASEPQCFPVLCPTCRARLHPLVSQVGKRVKCPDCFVVFVVPSPPPPEVVKPLATPGQYGVGIEPQRTEAPLEFLKVQGTMPPDSVAPQPPRFWFATGVFSFPWASGVWNRWLALSMLAVPAAEMVAVTLALVEMVGPHVVPLLVAVLVWLWLWTISYASACFMVIVQDTGSGNDEVTNWYEGDWRERLGPMAYTLLQLALAGAAAALVGLPVGRAWGPVVARAVSLSLTAAVFPVLLLSALEADQPLRPYSPVILRSLLKLWTAWAMVYLEGALVMVVALAVTIAAVLWNPFLGALVGCPLGATALFILARLIGRLAWRIGEAETTAARKKKRKKAVEEAA
ncbi:MAG TPA: hypothetical protein VND64_14780 [Pirellulales bacterium]|nr:hypothetical protein [Pirellulales bacterium]